MNLAQKPPLGLRAPATVSPAIRRSARGQPCTLRVPGICSGDPEQTVGAHLRMFNTAGMGQKPDDLHMVDACANCHAALDNRARWAELALGYDDILRALIETQRRRRAAGLIRLGNE